jgi:hypothetical protein
MQKINNYVLIYLPTHFIINFLPPYLFKTNPQSTSTYVIYFSKFIITCLIWLHILFDYIHIFFD